MSSAEEPLISRHASPSDDDHPGNNNNHDTADYEDATTPPSTPSASPTLFIYLLTFSAGISGLLFGCKPPSPFPPSPSTSPFQTLPITNNRPPPVLSADDTGVISSTLVSLNTSLSARPLTALDKSVITSSTSLLALLVSPFSSVLADRLGRKRVVLAADALFALGAALQAASRTVGMMVVGRAVVGMAVGGASFVVPLYIAELAPAEFRGRLVTMNVIFITLGQVVAYVVGWALGEFGEEGTAWRWMVGLGAVPAVVQAVVMAAMPETPRWLVMVGRVGEARRVVERVLGKKGEGREVDATVKGIEIEVREESDGRNGSVGWRYSLRELLGLRRNRRALAIACLLQGLQQLCGFVSCPGIDLVRAGANTFCRDRTPSCTSRLPSLRCSASRSRHSPRWLWPSPTLRSPSSLSS